MRADPFLSEELWAYGGLRISIAQNITNIEAGIGISCNMLARTFYAADRLLAFRQKADS
jgi:hypothetical protein